MTQIEKMWWEEANQKLAEKDAELAKSREKLSKKDVELNKKDAELNKKDAELNKKDAELNKKDAELTKRNEQNAKNIYNMISNAIRSFHITEEDACRMVGISRADFANAASYLQGLVPQASLS